MTRRRLLLSVASCGMSCLLLVGVAAAQNPKCSGSECLAITNIKHGTRCGTSDSIEADIQNVSGSMYLRGYVVYDTPKGPQRVTTGLMKPGEKGKFLHVPCIWRTQGFSGNRPR